MAQIPTPPASRDTSEALEIQKETEVDTSTDLLQSLDTLLERYLHLLDRHQELQAGLAKRLSSGFLSLAQANYTCPPGRKYGADYYDERMKATKKVSLCAPSKATMGPENPTESNNYKHTFVIQYTPDKCDDEQDKEKKASESPSNTVSFDENPDKESENNTQETGEESNSEQPGTDPTSQKPKPIKKFRSSDPIAWYGILVPLSLRSAQKSFTEAVNDHLSELANLVIEMGAVEKEVHGLRKRLNLNSS